MSPQIQHSQNDRLGKFPHCSRSSCRRPSIQRRKVGFDPHQDLRNETQSAKEFRKIPRYNPKGIGLRLNCLSTQATNVPADQRYPPDTNRIEVDIPQRLQIAHRRTCGTQTGSQPPQKPEPRWGGSEIYGRPRRPHSSRPRRPCDRKVPFQGCKIQTSLSDRRDGTTNKGQKRPQRSPPCCTKPHLKANPNGSTYSPSLETESWQAYVQIWYPQPLQKEPPPTQHIHEPPPPLQEVQDTGCDPYRWYRCWLWPNECRHAKAWCHHPAWWWPPLKLSSVSRHTPPEELTT